MSKEIKLTADELALMSMFQTITGVRPIHCVLENDNIFFLVSEEDYPKMIAEARHIAAIKHTKIKGVNTVLKELTKELARMLRKNIYIIKYTNDPEKFLRNFFMLKPDETVELYNRGANKKYAIIKVHPRRKGLIIGRAGFRAKVARQLAKKYFDLDTIIIK